MVVAKATVVERWTTVVERWTTVVVSASMELLFVTKLVRSSAEDIVERHVWFNALHVGSAIVRCGGRDVRSVR